MSIIDVLSWVIDARSVNDLLNIGSTKFKKHMKAVLEFNLPAERNQFETAARAESWCLLHHALIRDLTDLCHAENACPPTARQIQWLINHNEMKRRELKVDSHSALDHNEPDCANPPVKIEGISSVTISFKEMEDWLNRPNEKFGNANPLNLLCACGSLGAKLLGRELEKMEAEREEIKTSKNLAQTGRGASPTSQ